MNSYEKTSRVFRPGFGASIINAIAVISISVILLTFGFDAGSAVQQSELPGIWDSTTPSPCYSIADTSEREFAVSSAFDGNNFLVALSGNTGLASLLSVLETTVINGAGVSKKAPRSLPARLTANERNHSHYPRCLLLKNAEPFHPNGAAVRLDSGAADAWCNGNDPGFTGTYCFWSSNADPNADPTPGWEWQDSV